MKHLKTAVLIVILLITFTACESNNQDVNSVLSPTTEAASSVPTASPAPTTVPEESSMPSEIGLFTKDREDKVRRKVNDSFISVWQEQQDIECFEVFLTEASQVPWGTYGNVWHQYENSSNCKVGYFLNVNFTDKRQKISIL